MHTSRRPDASDPQYAADLLRALPPEVARLVQTTAKRTASEILARRDDEPYRWASETILHAAPQDFLDGRAFSETWRRVRAVYTRDESTWMGFARMHPAPFCEYVLRSDDTNNPETFGKRIVLAPFHIEWLQSVLRHDLVWWCKAREHGGTTLLIGVILWFLGRNPAYRIKLVCSDETRAARERLSALDRYLAGEREGAVAVRQVFPRLRRDMAAEWSSLRKYVERDTASKDASIEGYGVLSGATGGRCDLLVLDDITNRENTITSPAKKRAVRIAIDDDYLNLVATGGKVIGLSNYWTSDDYTQTIRTRAESSEQRKVEPRWRYLSHHVPDAMEPLWPEQWPRERLMRRKENLGYASFARGFHGRDPTREENDFAPEWFVFRATPPRSQAAFVASAIDTAGSRGEDSAWTAMSVLYVIETPPTEANPWGVHLHFADVLRWHEVKLGRKAKLVTDTVRRYNVDEVAIENAHHGPDLADLVGETLGVDVELLPAIESKRERLNRHQRLFRLGLVSFALHLDPERILAAGDDAAANPVAEILGTAQTMDAADVVEMAIRYVRDRYVLDLVEDEDGQGLADLHPPADEAVETIAIDAPPAPSQDRGQRGPTPDGADWWTADQGEPVTRQRVARAQPSDGDGDPRGRRRGGFQRLG